MKTTEEKNRMIAEFMGSTTSDGKYFTIPNLVTTTLSQMKYHTSWDWLMHVVGKIDKLMLDQPIDSPFEINAEEVFISLREVNIKLTFNRIVEFIEWYNENK